MKTLLEPKIKAFVRESLSVYMVEGYGQTENNGGISGTFFSNYCIDDGSVGTVLPCGAIKLVDVEGTDYLAENNQGEIFYKGSNMMMGYFKNKEKTRETMDANGWLQTGDIGEYR